MSDIERDDVRGLPPSAKLIYKTLEYTDNALIQQQLVEESRLSTRTVRYGLQRLKAIDVVEEEMNLADARQRFYTLVPEAVCQPRD